VDVFSYFPKVATYAETDSVSGQVTQQAIAKFSTDARINDDLAAGWRFLQAQPYTRHDRVGLVGFCGGGRDALLFAAEHSEAAAVVVFYAPARLELSNRSMLIDLARRIKTPIQGHYGLGDQGIPLEHVRELEQVLTAQGTQAEIFRYEAGHGFFAYNREESFAEPAAREAWGRVVPFLRAQLR
jgi:carboxymethylenebutenolidase